MFRFDFYMPKYSIEHCYAIYEAMPTNDLICEYLLTLKVIESFSKCENDNVSCSIVWEYASAIAQVMRNVLCERAVQYRHLFD